MFDEYIPPDELGFKGERLDELLSSGYYRMQDSIFTTNQVYIGPYGKSNMFAPVFWLRTNVEQMVETSSSKKIRRKCAAFKINIKPAEITDDIEELFALYRSHIDFDTYATCRDCMLEKESSANPFNSWMIEIWDNTHLIAVGYFDIGKDAAMAIINFYHPTYKKYSLGKCLILKTLDYMKENNMHYYYPGYICTTDNKMDYKVFPNIVPVQVYLPIEKEWMPYNNYTKGDLHAYFINKILGIDLENLENSADTDEF
jgi:arginine-tRNA-protein transferase